MRYKSLIFIVIILLSLFIIVRVSSQSEDIIGLIADDSGLGGSWYWVNTPTPHVITATIAASQTPWIVTVTVDKTVFPTHTPTTATPTQETTLPPTQPTMTSTPSPTMTPTLPPDPAPKCWGRVINADNGLRIREVPWGEIIGHVFTGDILAFDAKWYQDFWWYRIGWFDDGDPGYISANYVELDGGADCSELEDVTPAPSHTTKTGCHILMGEGSSACSSYVHNMQTAKCLPGSFHICLQMKQANPDLWITARLFNDKSAYDLDYDLLEFWERYGHQIPDGYDAWEPENESTPQTIDQWQRWSSFNIGLAKILDSQKNMQNLAFSFGPGWPAQEELDYILEYLEWVDDNPLPDGRYHGIASHAAMYAPWSRIDMPWVNEPWIAGKPYKINEYLNTRFGFELTLWRGVWVISEVGLSDGYSGNWSAEYSCDELASAFDATIAEYQRNGYPHAYQHWNIGQIGMWTSDHDCVAQMFG